MDPVTWVIIGVVALAGVGAAVYLLFGRTRRKARIIVAPPPPKPQGPMDTGRMKLSQAIAALVTQERYPEAIDLAVAQGDFKAAGRVALRMGQPLRAAEYFERAGDHESAATAYLKIPDFRRAAGSYAICKMHEKAAEVFAQIGDHYAAAEQWVAAGKIEKAVALHRALGNEIVASKLEGEMLMSQGNWIEAARAFENAGETLQVADCLSSAGRHEEAANILRKAGKLETAAALLEKAGSLSEAAALFEEAGSHGEAARIYKAIGDPDREIDAQAAAGHLLEAGHMAYKLGRRDKAEAILMQASPADRGFGRACLLLGKILEESGRQAEALKHYAQFLERTLPTEKNRSAYEFLAQLFEREGLPDVAFRALRRLDSEGLLRPEMQGILARVTQRVSIVKPKTPSEPQPAAPSPAPATTTGLPRQITDRYEIVRQLGEGGTAVVHLARDRILKRDVVLKFLANPSLPPELARDYFMREAQIVAGMSHPSITTVYDIGSAEGRHYIVMEYLEGETLSDKLLKRQGNPMKLRDVVVMARDLAQALAYAHERKIIHRDIKPGNVMVLPDGHAKLMDFGMAKALEVHKDRSIYICGTPDYMAPEQEAGLDLTPATDIYAMGLVILECLLGTLSSAATTQAARKLRIDALARSGQPDAVKRVINSCLAVDIDSRPSSALKVVEALAQVVISEPKKNSGM